MTLLLKMTLSVSRAVPGVIERPVSFMRRRFWQRCSNNVSAHFLKMTTQIPSGQVSKLLARSGDPTSKKFETVSRLWLIVEKF